MASELLDALREVPEAGGRTREATQAVMLGSAFPVRSPRVKRIFGALVG